MELRPRESTSIWCRQQCLEGRDASDASARVVQQWAAIGGAPLEKGGGSI